MATTILEVFECYTIEGEDRWVQQIDQLCFKGQHLALTLSLGLLGLVFWVALLPFGWLYLIFRLRNSLRTVPTMHKFLFLYHAYRPQFAWWEVARMMFMLLLTSIKVNGIGLKESQSTSSFNRSAGRFPYGQLVATASQVCNSVLPRGW